MTDAERFIWLAGILEGEGSFMAPAPYKPNSPTCEVEMTDEDVVRRIGGLLHRAVTVRNRSIPGRALQTTYRVRICGEQAVQLMCRLRRYMSARRQRQIDAAIAPYLVLHPDPPTHKIEKYLLGRVCDVGLCPTLATLASKYCEAHAPIPAPVPEPL